MQRLPHDAHCFGAIHRDHDEVNQDDVHFCPFRQQISHLLEGSGSVVRFVETAVTGDHLRRTLQNAPHNLPIQPGVVLQPHIIAIDIIDAHSLDKKCTASYHNEDLKRFRF